MNSSIPSSFLGELEAGLWEHRRDTDGFIYKILKKQKLSDPSQPAPSSDPKAEAKQRRERKRQIFLKLKSQYQKEIESWELLANTLREMEERAKQNVYLQTPQQKVNETASDSVVEAGGSSLIDDLLRKAEAQEAIIRDASKLCDEVEAIYDAREQQLAQAFVDLPVWSSPRELMASLCDSDE